MTTIVDAKEIIVEHFITEWAAATDVTLDGESFDPPVDTAWVRLSIRHNASNQESLGATGTRKFTRGGVVMVQVFGRLNKGSREADTLAQSAQAVFEGRTVSGIRFLDVVPREIGPSESWYQFNVEANFEYTETK